MDKACAVAATHDVVVGLCPNMPDADTENCRVFHCPSSPSRVPAYNNVQCSNATGTEAEGKRSCAQKM